MKLRLTPEERERRRIQYSICFDYWVCPNTGRIIQGMDHDDKVMCGCRKQNPKLPIPPHGGSMEHGHEHGGPICHIKKFLEPSTVDAFLRQQDIEESMKN